MSPANFIGWYTVSVWIIMIFAGMIGVKSNMKNLLTVLFWPVAVPVRLLIRGIDALRERWPDHVSKTEYPIRCSNIVSCGLFSTTRGLSMPSPCPFCRATRMHLSCRVCHQHITAEKFAGSADLCSTCMELINAPAPSPSSSLRNTCVVCGNELSITTDSFEVQCRHCNMMRIAERAARAPARQVIDASSLVTPEEYEMSDGTRVREPTVREMSEVHRNPTEASRRHAEEWVRRLREVSQSHDEERMYTPEEEMSRNPLPEVPIHRLSDGRYRTPHGGVYSTVDGAAREVNLLWDTPIHIIIIDEHPAYDVSFSDGQTENLRPLPEGGGYVSGAGVFFHSFNEAVVAPTAWHGSVVKQGWRDTGEPDPEPPKPVFLNEPAVEIRSKRKRWKKV